MIKQTIDKYAVVYISDFNDKEFLLQSITSLRFFDLAIPVFVLTDKECIDEDLCKNFSKYNIKSLNVLDLAENVFSNVKPNIERKWRKNVLYRLLIPYIAELSKFNRVLYVDTDTLFFNNFNFLFDLPYKFNYGMFYQRNHCELNKNCRLAKKLVSTYEYSSHNCQKLSLRFPFPYYNAGIVMFNNAKINDNLENWSFALCEFNRIYDPNIFIHNDQMFLNMFFDFDEYSSDEWNVNSETFSKNLIIGHFYGENKQLQKKRHLLMKAYMSVFNPRLFETCFKHECHGRESS